MKRPLVLRTQCAAGVLIMLCSGPPTPAQEPYGFASARVSVASTGPWAWTGNVAAVDSGPQTLSASYGVAPWGIKGLHDAGIHLHGSFGSVPFVAGLSGLTFGPLTDLRLSAAASHEVSGAVNVGASLRLRMLSVVGYEIELIPEFDIGVLLQPIPNVTFGATVVNATGSHADGSVPEQRMAIGLALSLGDSLRVTLDASQQHRRSASATLGLDWAVADGVALRGGASVSPPGLGFGASVASGPVGFDVSAMLVAPVGAAVRCSVSLTLDGSSVDAVEDEP